MKGTNHERFDNRTVIVTGGARGIGASHARGFVAEGTNVLACARPPGACAQGPPAPFERIGYEACRTTPLRDSVTWRAPSGRRP